MTKTGTCEAHTISTPPIARGEILTAGGESRGRGKVDASGFADKVIDF